MSNVRNQDSAEIPSETGSVVFCRLPHTNRITEFLTLAFYPLFFSVVGTSVFAGLTGAIFGAGTGGVLAVVAITFRRWGARWALSYTQKREQQDTDGTLDAFGEIAPHNNFMHLTEIFYISMEVIVISIISTYAITYVHYNNIIEFNSFYNKTSYLINYIFDFYSGSNNEINAHVGSIHIDRIFFIKSSVSMILCSVFYGFILSFVRMFIGWQRYIAHISQALTSLKIKNESKSLLPVVALLPLFPVAVYSIFYGGVEFFLIVGSITDSDWYMYVVIYKFIMFSASIVMFLFIPLSFLVSYLVLLYMYLFMNSHRKRI